MIDTPGGRSNHLRLAEALISLGKPQEALPVAEKVIELAQTQAYELSARVYDLIGDLPKAETLYRESLRRMGRTSDCRPRLHQRLKEIKERLGASAKK